MSSPNLQVAANYNESILHARRIKFYGLAAKRLVDLNNRSHLTYLAEVSMTRNILGIHDGHNASAAIAVNGQFAYAIQEERLTGVKNFNGYPSEAVRACLQFVGLGVQDVDELAFASIRSTPMGVRTSDQRQGFLRDATWYGRVRRSLWYLYYRTHSRMGWSQRLKWAAQLGIGEARCRSYDHHSAHAAAVYYGFRQDPSTPYLIITVDGFGDLDCSTVWISEQGEMRKIASTPLTDSPGSVYAYVTGAMGFTPLEHEYKLMGMAPYASAKYAVPLVRELEAMLGFDAKSLQFRRRTLLPTFMYQRLLRKWMVGNRFDSTCAALQTWSENLLVQLVKAAVDQTGIRRVMCSGGVFMNVKANKRLMELAEVDELTIFPSCGDETLSFGAAYLSHARHSQADANAIPPFTSIYLGSDVTESSCQETLGNCPHEVRRYDDVEAEIAQVLAAGKPVARCKGRIEFGARALGNRSILADPIQQDVVRVINQMVKKRDFWMPFAPAVRKERMEDYFVNPKHFDSPHMMLTFDTRDNFTDFIAAVHNADLTARPQVVKQYQNPDYYRLLEQFEARTGRGVLLNTSFNLHGYPIVLGPREALQVFDNSGLEFLNIGQYLVRKRPVAINDVVRGNRRIAEVVRHAAG
jgi:carbamoyltransferase